MCRAANPLRFPPVMSCSQQHSIGFIILCEVMRNGGIYHISVQWIHISVNHRAVQCVRLTVKIFMNFTRIDCKTEKLSRLCTARYGTADLCTLLYAGFAYQLLIQQSIFHLAVNCFTKHTGKIVFCG